MKPTILLVPALFLLSLQTSSGQFLTNRYVATNGVDGTSSCTLPQMPCRTVQHAIDMAESGDDIRIFGGVYTEPIVVILKNLDFVRHVSSDPVTIQAATSPGAINARTVTIIGPGSGSTTVSFTGITIRNGTANGGSGGGISCTQNCTLNLRNVFVVDNSADEEGGGVYIDDSSGESVFGNAVIAGNTAGTHGGGMRVVDSDLRLEDDVRVQANTAGGVGGGISLNGVDASFENVTIGGSIVGEGNTAGTQGGGIRTTGGSLTLRDVEVRSNEAGEYGGGINSSNTELQANDTQIILNTAEVSAGGLYQGTGNAALLTDVLFLLNEAVVSGGGLMATNGGRAVLEDVQFNSNKAGEEGGGLWNNHDETVLTRVVFFSNSIETTRDVASGFGGGMFTTDSSPQLMDVLFEGNQVVSLDDRSVWGGGMYILEGSPTLDNVSFIGNGVFPGDNFGQGTGGGVYMGAASPRMTNNVFYSNVVSEGVNDTRGGAIFMNASTPTLINATISGNRVEGNSHGGGIFALFDSHPLILNSIIWRNTADAGRQIVVGLNSSVQLEYSLYGNEDGDIAGVGDFEPGGFSIIANPIFVDPDNGNLQLSELSPALDAGHPDSDAFDYPLDEELNKIDLEANPRFFGERVDLGAYEFQGTPTSIDETPVASNKLTAPWPNPARHMAAMELRVSTVQDVRVEVFDVLGRKIVSLYSGTLGPGSSEKILFDVSLLPSGMYIVRASGTDFAATQAVTAVR